MNEKNLTNNNEEVFENADINIYVDPNLSAYEYQSVK